jgi:leucyl aminopeptidase (aminopeptidase T)
MVKAEITLEQAATKLLKEIIRVKREERILIVKDKEKDQISEAFKKAATKIGGKVKVVKITSKRNSSSPIPEIREELIQSDVVIAPTSKSITHSHETIEAANRGARVASMPGITKELVIKASKTNLKECTDISDRLLPILQKSKVINIITSSGTNFAIRPRGYKFETDAGIILKGHRANIPYGEIFCYLKGGNGQLAIDSYGKMIKQNSGAMLQVRNGKILKWNNAANEFVEMLKKAGECGLKTVELGIGTNPEHKAPIGNVLHDEKIYGSAHIAFGGGKGIRECSIHADIILMHPTIWVDGRKIMEKGKLIK